MARKSLAEELLEAGMRVASRTAERFLQDRRGQEVVARTVGFAQRGRKRFGELQERLLSTAGIPARRDYEDLARQLARIKRKTRELAERIASADARRDGDDETR
jgi:hypothetical protein